MILGNLPNILNMIIWRVEKFLRAFEKLIRVVSREEIHSQNLVNICSKKLVFWLKTIFQRRLETLLWVVWSCSIDWEGRLWSYIYTQKRIRVIRHVKRIIRQETYKSLDFWEIHSQNLVGIWFKNTYFWGEFFSKSLKKFSSRRIVTFNISGRLSKIISLLSKKNWSHTTHRSKDIDKKLVRFEKNPVQNAFPSDHCNIRWQAPRGAPYGARFVFLDLCNDIMKRHLKVFTCYFLIWKETLVNVIDCSTNLQM